MSYRVLALKYRPQSFDDVIGQAHVTTTLSNAIRSDRVAHAILLTGPRGTGKTTIARIMAKAMNCAEGPTAQPCNVCKSCIQITNGNAPDVFEIDGASNNSVDQIRELRSNVTYMPASSAFKIYIIDEVHMLSMAAFNALLKTLEEPPEHVIFIFATTESHKIPITILSRCQRHDLGRLKLSGISDHLQNLCTQEGFTVSNESCDLVASEADGSMRDALSLLDRILSSTPNHTISHDAILNNLGIIDKKMLFDLSQAILNHDVPALLMLIETVSNLGMDLKKFYSAVIRQFRNLAVIRACAGQQTQSGVSDLSDNDIDLMRQQSANVSPLYLTQLLNLLLKEEQLIKFAAHTRTALEMVLLKLIQIRPGSEIDALIQKLDALAGSLPESSQEKDGATDVAAESNASDISDTSPSATSHSTNQTASSRTSQVPPQRLESGTRETTAPFNPGTVESLPPPPTATPPAPPIAPGVSRASTGSARQSQPPVRPEGPSKMEAETRKSTTPPPPEAAEPPTPVAPEPIWVPEIPVSDDFQPPSHTTETAPNAIEDAMGGEPGSTEPTPPVPAPTTHQPEQTKQASPKRSWKGFIKAVSQEQKVIATILDRSAFKELTDNELIIELQGTPFDLSRMNAKKEELDRICSDYFEKRMRLKVIDKTNKKPLESEGGVSTSKMKQEARNHPLVMHAVNLFSGNIVDVKTTSQKK